MIKYFFKKLSYLFAYLLNREWFNYFRYILQKNPFLILLFPLEYTRGLIFLVRPALEARIRRFFSPLIRNFQKKINLPSLSDIFIDPTLTTSLATIEYFTTRTTPRYLFSLKDISLIKEKAQKLVPEEVSEIITRAEKILAGVFPLFSKIEFRFSNRVNWQYPFDDREKLFYLNRWYHGLTLAKAFAYTGNNRYAQGFVELLEDWARTNPCDSTSSVWESYSVGERIVNWIFAYHLLLNSEVFRSRGLTLLLRLLALHAEYLIDHLELKEAHNHLINNARALFEFGLLFPEIKKSSQYLDIGLKILIGEAKRQFRPDGMLGEQSTHYHFLLIRTYLEVGLLAKLNHLPEGEILLKCLHKMLEAAEIFIRPDGTIPLIGDFSPDSDLRSLVGLVKAGAIILNTPSIVKISEHALWFISQEINKPNFSLKTSKSKENNLLYQLPDSGYIVFRSDKIHFTFHADPLAKVIWHGHCDALSFDLWANDRPIISDSGNYSFNNDTWRKYFRGPQSHSTIVVDRLSPYVLPDYSWALMSKNYTQAQTSIKVSNSIIEGKHTGYCRLYRPVTISRRIQVIPDKYVLISDFLSGGGEHFVEIFFQFGCNRIEGQEIITPDNKKLAKIEFRSDCRTDTKIITGWYSQSYGVKIPSTIMICYFKMQKPVRVNTLIWLAVNSILEWPNI